MTAGHIIILLAVLAAVAYLGYRVKRAFEAIHDPCRGCPGCALKGKISGRERHRMRKKQCEEIKNAQKFGGIKKKQYLCIAFEKKRYGAWAGRLGNGLQNRVEQFDSARHLIEGEDYYCSSLFVYATLSAPPGQSGIVRQIL